MITFIKLFIRSLKRNRLFSFVNIIGLTVGFFTATLIYLYVEGELSYDQFHENGDQIYRVNQTFIWGEDNPNQFSSTGPGVAHAILEDIPEAEYVVRIHTRDFSPITFALDGQEKFFNEERIFAIDSSFFEMFNFSLVNGDIRTALKEPQSVILKHETAIRFFGDTDVVGRLIAIGNEDTYIVTGVLDKINQNSYLNDFDLLISMNSIDKVEERNWSWIWTTFETFVLFKEGTDFETIEERFAVLPKKHTARSLRVMGYNWEEYIAAGKEWNLYLQPFQDIRLHSSSIYNRLSEPGDMKIVVALIASAIFLLILSCINFINLSTAQFTSRAKDVALRKVLGGTRQAFIQRFFGESLFYCVISILIAFFLLVYTLPIINQALDISLSFSVISKSGLIGFILILIGIVSLVSGIFPFIFFDAFKPIAAMKGEFKTGNQGIRLRNGMLVIQYMLSFVLILGTFTIYQQLNFFANANLGYEKENILVIQNAHWTGAQEEFTNELAKVEGVKSTSLCDALPTVVSNGDQFIPDKPEAGSFPLNFAVADENYLDILKLELLVGRFFDESYRSDSAAVILNEAAVRSIGWPLDESILNKKISNYSGQYHLIGIVKDFNFWSLHAPIEPFGIFNTRSNAGYDALNKVMVKSVGTTQDFNSLTSTLEAKWKEFVPNRPFEHFVLSDHYIESYRNEARFGDVLSFFSLLTIIVASLGLFGIVVFSIEQKLKEIGVRKVLGASVGSLIVLFSKDYIKLLAIAFIIAAPFGYYFMENWLSDFEYRIQMSPWVFLAAFTILLLISMAISIFHTSKASLMNPSEVLKDE